MRLGDIWQKMGRQLNITPQEAEYLRLNGNETQQRNAQVSGFMGADGNPHFPGDVSLDGSLRIGKNTMTPISARFYMVGDQNITTGGTPYTTIVTLDGAEYNDGFTLSSNKVYIPVTGIYQITIGVSWGTVVNGTIIALRRNGSTSDPIQPGMFWSLMAATSTDERLLQAGHYIEMTAYHTHGSTQTLYSANVAIRMIRTQ